MPNLPTSAPIRQRQQLLFAVFFVSGFCGLIYESIWSHYLKLLLGHAAYAQALVLVVFVGGLALGAWLTSRFSERIRSPILAYALVELLVGLMAFAFHRVFVLASDWALAELLPSACSAGGACWATWALAAVLILPAAVLLGSTFPLMTAGLLRMGMAAGRGLSLLYFLNSAGAALGVLCAGFWLIPDLGLPGTLLVAGAMNVAVAMAAYAAARRQPSAEDSPPAAVAPAPLLQAAAGNADSSGQPGARRLDAGWLDARWLLAIACLTGLSSFIYEVVWIRMLTQVLGAATHSFELMLASFILGLALGGGWIRNRIDSLANPERFLAQVQIAMGVLAVATLPLYLWSFEGMGFVLAGLSRTAVGYQFFHLASAAIAMAVMLPAAFCAGMTLPLITAVLLRRGGGERRIGQVYGVNTLGAIMGVLLTVYWLMPWLGLKWALATGAVIDVALGCVILGLLRPSETQPEAPSLAPPEEHALPLNWATAWPVAGLTLVLLIPAFTYFDPRITSSGVFRTALSQIGSNQQVIFHQDGRTGTISVIERDDGLLSLLTNGKVDGSANLRSNQTTEDDRTITLLAVLGPAHFPGAKTAAVIGMGSGITSAVLLKSSALESVETIEIEPQIVQAAHLFRPRSAAAFDDPRSQLVIDDAKAHFAKSSKRYDIIASEPSNPWVSGVAGLFSQEFYRQVARKLSANGHFVQWLQLYESSPEVTGSVLAAFGSVFPNFEVYASNLGDVLLVARADGQPAVLNQSALSHPGMAAELKFIGVDSIHMLAAHHMGSSNLYLPFFQSYGEPPANSDYFPYVDGRAAKDRFMRQTSSDMQNMHLSPVPIMQFGSNGPAYLGQVKQATSQMPRKLIDLASAWYGQRYLQGQALLPAESAYFAGYLRDYELVRGWLWDCRAVPDNPSLWNSALLVAGEINPGLPAAQAQALWQGVLDGPCGKQLPQVQRDWLALFAAVGGRDAARTRSAADRVLMLGERLTPSQHEYAVLAAVLARLALGEQAQAKQVLENEGKRIGSDRLALPWIRYMTVAVAAKPADNHGKLDSKNK